jgi:hypothetical protein
LKFAIQKVDRDFATVPLGPSGQELAGFIPAGRTWRQLNYGQGEGQVEVDGCEWGFYYAGPGILMIVLHRGEVEMSKAVEFVSGVAARITDGPQSFRIIIQGGDGETG